MSFTRPERKMSRKNGFYPSSRTRQSSLDLRSLPEKKYLNTMACICISSIGQTNRKIFCAPAHRSTEVIIIFCPCYLHTFLFYIINHIHTQQPQAFLFFFLYVLPISYRESKCFPPMDSDGIFLSTKKIAVAYALLPI